MMCRAEMWWRIFVCFKGYPLELIPLTVARIPSMHICIEFIHELIAQPHVDKQVWPWIFYFMPYYLAACCCERCHRRLLLGILFLRFLCLWPKSCFKINTTLLVEHFIWFLGFIWVNSTDADLLLLLLS